MAQHYRRGHEREGRPVRATVVRTHVDVTPPAPERLDALRRAAEAVAAEGRDPLETWALRTGAPPGTVVPRSGEEVGTVRMVVAARDVEGAAGILGVPVEHLRAQGERSHQRRDVLRSEDRSGTVLMQLRDGGCYLERDDPQPILRRLALGIAIEAHRGVVDKAGNPYIEHPMAVAEGLDDPIEEAVALLHDTVEDTTEESALHVTLDLLRSEGMPEEVVEGVDAISRRPKEMPEAYLRRVAACPQARNPKRKDIDQNSDPGRLALIDDEATRQRLTRKYAKHRRLLEDEIRMAEEAARAPES